MTIEYTIGNRPQSAGSPAVPNRRPSRIACLVALAHRFDELVRSGEVKDYAELARLGHVTRARVTQIMNLLSLAPEIQESLLWFPAERGHKITERDLRRIASELRWDRQRALFDPIQKAAEDHSAA